MLQMEKQTAAK